MKVDLACSGRLESDVDTERESNPVTQETSIDDSSIDDRQRTEDETG